MPLHVQLFRITLHQSPNPVYTHALCAELKACPDDPACTRTSCLHIHDLPLHKYTHAHPSSIHSCPTMLITGHHNGTEINHLHHNFGNLPFECMPTFMLWLLILQTTCLHLHPPDGAFNCSTMLLVHTLLQLLCTHMLLLRAALLVFAFLGNCCTCKPFLLIVLL